MEEDSFPLPARHRLQRFHVLRFPATTGSQLSTAGSGAQDNATYHTDGDVWAWFDANRHWLEVHQLPPYSPALNPTERLWRYTRQTGTHNRYFPDEKELIGTLSRVFGEMQTYPELIRPYLQSFL
ncbi:MAG: hypothetical protein DMG38_03325 [Acidobacteria bacterium]|nr:MAG: hypothetical protein DMG38_03325 [Acidobacteriota bacterium]